MRWSEEYATGIERVDEQHKTIFQMADDFRAALEEGGGKQTYGLLLDFLDRYCRSHFRFEERCMDDYQCPMAQKNKEDHERFVDVLSGFRQRYAVNGFDHAEACTLMDTIDRWLAEHICGVDMHLKHCAKTA